MSVSDLSPVGGQATCSESSIQEVSSKWVVVPTWPFFPVWDELWVGTGAEPAVESVACCGSQVQVIPSKLLPFHACIFVVIILILFLYLFSLLLCVCMYVGVCAMVHVVVRRQLFLC